MNENLLKMFVLGTALGILSCEDEVTAPMGSDGGTDGSTSGMGGSGGRDRGSGGAAVGGPGAGGVMSGSDGGTGGSTGGALGTGGAVGDPDGYRVIMSSDFPPIDVCNIMDGCDCPVEQCSDPDDVQSMVRFLLYTNELQVEALIAAAGTYAMVAKKQNVFDILDVYDQVDENLRTHDPLYPTAGDLRAVTFEGRGSNSGVDIQWGCDKQPAEDIIGEGKQSEASEAIIEIVDRPDPRPVYVGVWGGPREIAQAIWNVQQTRTEQELDAFISKLRVFLITCQDATHTWLMNNFPNLFIIDSRVYSAFFCDGGSNCDQQWVETNLRSGHGPLGAVYPPAGSAVHGVMEGDSPSFMHLISANRGYNDPENPAEEGSWGGTYERDGETNHWVNGSGASISSGRDEMQAEFAERADWMVE